VDFPKYLAAANDRLKAGGIKATIRQRKQSLAIRATFPPKPGEDKPKQRDLALGYSANPAALKLAEIKAKEIALAIESGKFDWRDYLDPEALQLRETVGHWVNEFETKYFESRDRSPTKLNTYDQEYRCVFNHLSDCAILTPQLLKTAILSHSKPDSRQRKRWVTACQKLADLAELNCNFRDLTGSYSPNKVIFKDLPSDEEILSWVDKVPDEWRWAYCAIAIWGIRPHELWHLNTSRLTPKSGVLEVEKGKTGARSIYPCPWEWYVNFEMWEVKLEYVRSLTAKNNKELGRKPNKAFKSVGIPWHPYLMRHAYSAKLAVRGVSIEIASKWMGHSSQVHGSIYCSTELS
jgi:integrase